MPQLDLPKPFWIHIYQLRLTLIYCIFVICFTFVVSLYFHETLFDYLTAPLDARQIIQKDVIRFERIHNTSTNPILYRLPPNASLIDHPKIEATEITIEPKSYLDLKLIENKKKLIIFGPLDGFLTILKACFWISFVGSSPLWLYLIFRYISPALDGKEKKRIIPFFLLSLIFMCFGFSFAYYFTIPFANHFFLEFNLNVGENLWSLNHYLNYTTLLILSNGFAFEFLVIMGFLVHYQMISVKTLAHYRRHIYVLIFIISAILTPPDVVTQLMLAIPLIGLFECMLLYFRIGSLKLPISHMNKIVPIVFI